MTRTIFVLTSVTFAAMVFGACWNPSVGEVPITAPWDKMNLPIKENARVWHSSEKELRVVFKASRADVAKTYFDSLEKNGWKFTGNPVTDENIIINEYEKNGQHIRVDISNFPEGGTNVITRVKE